MFRGEASEHADAGGRLLADLLLTVRKFESAYIKTDGK